MKTLTRNAAALALLAAAALPLSAAGRTDDPLALVPENAASVAMIRLADLRTSPLSARLFSETDKITVDGDAARFMEEANLRPKEDVDVVVIAGSPKGTHDGTGLVLFEGRFEAARLSSAVLARGARKVTTPAGDYLILPEKSGSTRKSEGAVAFVSDHLVIAGTEEAVAEALTRRGGGGSRFLSGAGLGQHLSRIEAGATAWALVDVARWPQVSRMKAKADLRGDDGSPLSVGTFVGAMKSVSFVAFQATAKGDSLRLTATGLSGDEETRELLEDSIRGILAAVRMAAQEKSPETVSLIRKFKVQRDREGVTVSGTIPGAFVRAIAEKTHRHEK